MKRAAHLILIAAAMMGLLALGAPMDGPSDLEVERAVQADLQDAIKQTRIAALEVARLRPRDCQCLVPLPSQAHRFAELEQE
ncbi:hypothetical protein [Malikia sp.]|uniref:hypothetical protein n=1 Tax=Malikia sp. TaxID=2070706 RepID=UPI00262A8D15|nr:hypothetical protein [Malikia sp.]MDD2728200.1 hypothetical protein [Malikia sp.]